MRKKMINMNSTIIKENCMNNRINSVTAGTLLCCVIMFVTVGILACKQPVSTAPTTWPITVEYDSDTGTAHASLNAAPKGTIVTVNAVSGSKYKFKSWVVVTGGITLADNYTNPAAFTMPGNAVTIRAEFDPLADIALDDVAYGYNLPPKRSIGIAGFGVNTQTVSGITMEQGDESPFVLDAVDIANKIIVGNVIAFFIQPHAGLKVGSYTDSVVITHGGGKTTIVDMLITVTPRPLTITGLAAENKEYNGTIAATITGTAKIEGLIDGDDVELSGGAAVFEDRNAGNGKTVIFSDFIISGADAHNYVLTQPQGITANISPRSVYLVIASQPSIILIPFGATAVANSGNTYQQNVTLGLDISGAINGDTVTVMVSENNFGLSGSNTDTPDALTAQYDGSQVDQITQVQVQLNVTGNYRLNAFSNPTFNVRIRDGLATDRWLPVLNANIAEFNDYAASADGLKRHYRLVEDIMLTKPQASASNWTSIGTHDAGFTGSFDGNGFVISNLTINSMGDNHGLFGVVAIGGIIQNSALVDTDINGFSNVGGLAGINTGTIQTSYVTGCVSGVSNIGGLAGINNGVVQNCYVACNVNGEQYVGGAVGITNGTVRYCYTMGRINSILNIGGITGYVANGASLINCVALNNKVTLEVASTLISRVAGSASISSTLANNYARKDMAINKTIVNDCNGIDGESINLDNYRSQHWLTYSGNWSGASWDFISLWQMNERSLPKLRSAGGNQNHDLLFTPEEVWIESGIFDMGSYSVDSGHKADEGRHTVNLSGFYISKYELASWQYNSIMEIHGSSSAFPASDISWYDTLVFCNKLSKLENLSPAYRINNSTDPKDWGVTPTSANAIWDAVEIVTGSTGYRLPTEAQWEYACKAGTDTEYASGTSFNSAMGWIYSNSGIEGIKETGLTQPNKWGIYDMYGNVSEWCWDWYGAYSSNTQTDPLGAPSGTARVHRGGNINSMALDVRSAARFQREPYISEYLTGIRLVRP